MSGLRAKRTAAMMEAAITMIEAKRSCCFRLSCSSLAIALFISPISALPRDAAHQETCATVSPKISPLAGSASWFHITDSRQQSNCLALFRPERGWSRRIVQTPEGGIWIDRAGNARLSYLASTDKGGIACHRLPTWRLSCSYAGETAIRQRWMP